MGIYIEDFKKWLELLEKSREELLRIYGSRVIKGIPLYVELDRAIKKARSGNDGVQKKKLG